MQILVTGATGQIGDFLPALLAEAGHTVKAVSRKPPPGSANPSWLQADLDDPASLRSASEGCEALIHMAPIWKLPPHLPVLAQAGIKRIIAFSSTSRYGKRDSSDSSEQQVVNQLIQGEEALAGECEKHAIAWTLFRPTLIYGAGRDKNVTSIKRFIERWGFFPIVGKGSGLRQPVHAADLAQACLGSLNSEAARNKAYNLSGGETLSYRQMVERVFESLGRKPRILPLPLMPLRLALRVGSVLPGYGHIRPEMADRMNRDLVYGHAEARGDFGYEPRGFRP